MNNDTTMKLDMLHEAIGLIDFDLIEESEEAPAQAKPARVAAFAKKPWMKWVAAAAAIVVFAVGTPVALNMMGVFKNDNYVSPGSSGSDNSGIVTPVGSSDDESSSGPASEDASSLKDSDSSSHGSENPAQSSGQGISGSSAETPDVSSSGAPDVSSSGTPSGSDVPDQPEGDFVKDNMPAVTYKINGEYKTFDYQSSTAVVDSGGSYVIDHYVGNNGGRVVVNAETGNLVRYDGNIGDPFSVAGIITSEEKAVEKAKQIIMNTDIPFDGFDDLSAFVEYYEDKYFIELASLEGVVEVCVSNTGELVHLIING